MGFTNVGEKTISVIELNKTAPGGNEMIWCLRGGC